MSLGENTLETTPHNAPEIFRKIFGDVFREGQIWMQFAWPDRAEITGGRLRLSAPSPKKKKRK